MSKFRVAIRTVGCRANQADSAWLGRSLDPTVVDVVDPDEAADLVVINSCAVTMAAERDVRKSINKARRINGPKAPILLTGCMVTACADRIEELGPLWRVVPSTERQMIPALVSLLSQQDGVEMEALDLSSRDGFSHVPEPLRRARPSLRVQDGCEHRCAYCAVPVGRGPQRSMDLEEVLERLDALADEGAAEVVVCGINLGEWGRDLRPRRGLADLIEVLEMRATVQRIRLSSIEPWALNEESIEYLAQCCRIAPHLHLPLQSGDDAILRRMNRPYGARRFRELLDRLMTARGEMSLGTDVIAGFPGEDDTSFSRTIALIEELPLSYIHAFGYSPRPGTPAFSMESTTPKEVVKARVAQLRALGATKRDTFIRSLIGDVVHPLFERVVEGGGTLRGVTGRFVVAFADGPQSLVNRIVPVVVQSVRNDGHLLGTLLNVD